MSSREFHRVSVGLLVTVGLCGLTSMLNSAAALADTADSPLGDGTALVFGGTVVPTPPEQYVDAADTLYLQPLGFTGTAQSSYTPEGSSALDPNTLGYGTSLGQDQQIMVSDIESQIAAGGVSPENPVVVFGYSQSSEASSLLMPQLQADGVPSDDVHFVLVGDLVNPNGGFMNTFDFPAGNTSAFTALDVPFEPATPSDLYPTDIYTLEYDGFADFPHYTTNLLSDLNAMLGFFLAHSTYLDLTPDQINNAILLPGSEALTGEGLTDYYMIPNDTLPILEPLLLIPGIGQPLYDLLEPDTQILVNLGYGSITEGWNQGPANVPTTFGLSPDINQTQLSDALSNGWQQGVTDALHDLANPSQLPRPGRAVAAVRRRVVHDWRCPREPVVYRRHRWVPQGRRLPAFRRDAQLVTNRHHERHQRHALVRLFLVESPGRRNQCGRHRSPRIRREHCHGSARCR